MPKGIDMLITEGTMLSGMAKAKSGCVQTEEEPGRRAEELFWWHKYNFVPYRDRVKVLQDGEASTGRALTHT